MPLLQSKKVNRLISPSTVRQPKHRQVHCLLQRQAKLSLLFVRDIVVGLQTMQLSAADVCGNAGTSATVSVELQIPGCTSNIGGFDTNPAILGATDGIRSGNELTLDINGRVDLLDQACVGAQILTLS